MKIGFVICSRPDSKRVPRKCFAPLAGRPLIEHLVERCLATGFPVVVAVPGKDYESYRFLRDRFPENLYVHVGQGSDPLARTANVANGYDFDAVIRVCHDKIFVEKTAVDRMVDTFTKQNADYVFSSSLPAGASLEVISRKALNAATLKFSDVEHISYAIRCVTDKVFDVDFSDTWKTEHRLLVDFPEDLRVLDVLLQGIPPGAGLDKAIAFLDKNPWISEINRPPAVTVYTCAFNGAKWIDKAMGSVAMQTGFRRMEYLLIDDASTDHGATALRMTKFADTYRNARVIRNEKNLGLASSSNVALSAARAPFIIRLDADDYFTEPDAIARLVSVMQQTGADAVYPDNFFGSRSLIQPGAHAHHVGGALFRARAANHVKFTEGLRGYEGLDFFNRARAQLKVTYLRHPIFFYRQHPNSMSRTNLEARARILETLGAARVG